MWPSADQAGARLAPRGGWVSGILGREVGLPAAVGVHEEDGAVTFAKAHERNVLPVGRAVGRAAVPQIASLCSVAMFTNLTALDRTEVVIEPRQHFLNHVLKIGRCVPGIENHVALVLWRST